MNDAVSSQREEHQWNGNSTVVRSMIHHQLKVLTTREGSLGAADVSIAINACRELEVTADAACSIEWRWCGVVGRVGVRSGGDTPPARGTYSFWFELETGKSEISLNSVPHVPNSTFTCYYSSMSSPNFVSVCSCSEGQAGRRQQRRVLPFQKLGCAM